MNKMQASDAPDLLREYGNVTRVALCDYLGPRAPQRHLYSLVADYPRRGGRMLRSSLCIAAARMLGAELEKVVPPAVSIELMHNAFLVHDDVEDESEVRRGWPTLNALHGVSVAVNVGDALVLLALRAVMDARSKLGQRTTMRVLEELESTARESVEGQATELGWRRDNVPLLADADYLHMVLKKTCWYTTICPLRIGAIVAGREGGLDERVLRFGFFLGAAFQIEDDVLNLVDGADGYGKETAGDLWEGKRTLMLIHLLRRAGAGEQERLHRFLGQPRSERNESDVAWVRERMDAYGCLEHARTVAHALAGAAQHEFEALYGELPASRDKSFIEALPRWVLERT